MIYPQHLRQYVIRPVLRHLALPNPDVAEELLILTAAHESRCGYFLHQVKGPAIGIYQMEPATHNDIWKYLRSNPSLESLVDSFTVTGLPGEMAWNLSYATAMARVMYFRVSEPLPSKNDVLGLAQYWKSHYNTFLGAGRVEQAMDAYLKVMV